MSSTEFNIGLSGSKNSSRVLKPPGGGHSDIFGAADQQAPGPRPKYDQQNSSNLNFCMNTTDPNVLVEQCQKPAAGGGGSSGHGAAPAHLNGVANGEAAANARSSSADSIGSNSQKPAAEQAKPNRVPPGGFSSGLW